MRKLTFFLLTTVLVLSACAAPLENEPLGTIEPAPSSSASGINNISPTATIIWFPATSTWTPFPPIEPSETPKPFPGLGDLVFTDDFSNLKNWTLASSNSSGGNSIILDRNRLTLAANVPPAALASLNTGLILTNFFAEMTVTVNRCFGPDTYGMLFRASSPAYTYRFLVNCMGKARVERIRDSVTLPLQDWLASGDAPSSAPGQVKIGVWASGVEMRFFLNGHYQFTVIDPVFKSGTLGAYASAQSVDGLNISFSNLTINSVDYVSPTPTLTPSKTPTSSRTPRPNP